MSLPIDFDPSAALEAVSNLGADDATPEQRRAALEELLRELQPLASEVFADRPVVVGAVALALDAIDKGEGGYQPREIAALVRDFTRLLGLGRARTAKVRGLRVPFGQVVAGLVAKLAPAQG